MLFSRIQRALNTNVDTFFEPDQLAQFENILSQGADRDTLTKVLIGRVKSENHILNSFDKHIMIFRDPRDQFVSMLLYLFYDFQLSGDQAGYDECFAALERKQRDPEAFSAIDLYSRLAACVGRAPVAVFNNLHRVQSDYMGAFSPHLACYEDLLRGRWSALESYLGMSLEHDAQVPDQYTRVVRSKGYGDWRRWLNADDIEYTNAQWSESILALGYTLGEVEMNQAIAVETSTDYVKQFNPRHFRSSLQVPPDVN